MSGVILTLLASALSLASAVVGWWIANSPRVRAQRLLARIRALEQEANDAVAHGDMDRVALALHELRELRQTRAVLGRFG